MQRMQKLIIYIILLKMCCQNGIAQIEVSHFNDIINYTEDNGLPSNYITDIQEDKFGFLWLATGDGVSRYDGNHFTNFRYYYKDTIPLEIGIVNALVIDESGDNIWMGGEKGIFRSSIEDISFGKENMLMLQENKRVKDILFDEDQYLWTTNQNRGLIRIDAKNSNQQTFTFCNKQQKEDTNLNSIVAITKDPQNSKVFWLGTLAGLIRFDTFSKEYEVYVYNNNPEAAHNRIRKIYASEEEVYLGTWEEGFLVFNKQTKAFHQPLKKHFPKSHYLILDIYKVKEGSLWITTSHGVIQYNILSENIEKIIDHNPAKGIVRGVSFIDSRKIIWFYGSKGLFQYDPLQSQNTFIELEERSNLQSPMYLQKVIKSGRYFYAVGHASSGIYKIDPTDYAFEILKIPYLKHIEGSGYHIADMIEMNDGRFLILSLKKLVLFDPKTQKFEKSPLQIPHSSPTLRKVVKDRFGNFWIGTRHGGLYCLNYNDLTITNYKEQFNEFEDGNHVWMEYLFIDSQDRLWIRTASYLSVMDLNTRAIQNLRPDKNGTVYFNTGGFQEDDDGRIWVTGHEEGMGFINPKNLNKGICHQIDGYYNKLYENNENQIWAVGKNLGLLNTRKMTHKDIMLNLRGNKLRVGGPVIKNKKKEFIIGCDNGILIYNPEKEEIQKELPIPYIRKVTSDGNIVYEGNSLTKKDFKFDSGTKHVAVNISSLGFRLSDQVSYKYKLQKQWIDVGESQEINFTNLTHGDYVLKIKAFNTQGIYNQKPVEYIFEILPAWYNTWWAYTTYIVSLLTIIIVIVKQRSAKFQKEKDVLEAAVKMRTAEIIEKNSQLELQAKKLREMDKVKSRFFANISHEFRTPITLIKGPLSAAVKKEDKRLSLEQIKMIDRNADRLLRLVNQLLDLSKLDAGSLQIELEEGDLYYFLRAICSSFHSHARQRNIGYTTAISAEILIARFDHDKLEKIIYNLLSNAFKYSPDYSEVNFSVLIEHDILNLTVSDTGKGISEDQLPLIFDRFYQVDDSSVRDHEGTGIGLSLTKELLTLMEGEIVVDSKLHKGTTFRVAIPIKIIEVYGTEKHESGILQNKKQIINQVEENKLFDREHIKNAPIILVVEDNEDMRRYIISGLSTQFRVLEAVHGGVGLEIARREIPDLIITDLMMPQMDGISLCKNIRSDEKTSHIPMIMLTAKAQKESKIKGLIHGVDDYLTKPFDNEELLIRVQNLIDQRKKLRALYSSQISIEPKQIMVTTVDEDFLDRVLQFIDQRLSDPEFGVKELQKKVAMSKTQLHRKMKALTDQAPGEFLRNYRLKRATQLLSIQRENIAQIAFAVGFNSPSYFTKCFKNFYGVSPSDFIEKEKIDI